MSPSSQQKTSFKTTAIQAHQSVPVYHHLSTQTREQLQAFCVSGNAAHRDKQLAELLKAVEWLSWEALPQTPLSKLPEPLRRDLKQEIHQYWSSRAEVKARQSEHRKSYQLNVMDYFRQTVSSADKALLESLRDYELNRTGRDANWQHYFSLKSYKRIDEFVAMPHGERLRIIAAFQQDVAAYLKNKQRWQTMAQCATDDGAGFDFDDWCDWVIQEGEPHDREPKQKQAHRPKDRTHQAEHLTLPVIQALKQMGLPPQSSWDTVKKQFRALTLKHHPDMPGGNPELMKGILSAYALLKDKLQG